MAGVDQMSGGRVELGLGAGWFEAEHTAYGIAFPPVRERFDRLEEQLAVITGLWRTPPGETFDFDGAHYRLSGLARAAQAGAAPRPPIIVGGGGQAAHARTGGPLSPTSSTPRSPRPGDLGRALFERVRARLHRGQAATRRRCGCRPPTCCAAGATRPRCAVVPTPSGRTCRRPAGDRSSAALPAQLVDRLGVLAETGVTRAYLQVLDLHDLDHLELVAAQVAPQLG